MCGVSRATVAKWQRRAANTSSNDTNIFADRRKGRPAPNRTLPEVEQCVLAMHEMCLASDLGEHGAAAIYRRMEAWRCPCLPCVRTINDILARHGKLDGRHRKRRPAPPRAWYLPEVCGGQSELDCGDYIESLRIENVAGFVNVFNMISTHGGLADSVPMERMTAENTVSALIGHWRRVGLPTFAQFDNSPVFCGPPKPDCVGRVIRLCLSLGVTPVFAPPSRMGFQAAIEGYNGKWQKGVWDRFHFASREQLTGQSARYVAAWNDKYAQRIADAPPRRPFPAKWPPKVEPPLRGKIIFLRYTDDAGFVRVLQRRFFACRHWTHRLVRCELDLARGQLILFRLRRREPTDQPVLILHEYAPLTGGLIQISNCNE